MTRTTILAALLTLGTFPAYPQEPAAAGDSSAVLAAIADDQPAGGDSTRPPADFVDVDKEPVLIAKKEPVYPASARKAGMEGKVWVKIWVDKSGLVREADIVKSDQEIFNAPALDAAREFRFTPATMKGKPVDVWVTVPFKFKLAEKREADTTRGKFPDAIMNFTREVLEGGSPDPAIVNAFVPEEAQSIAHGALKPLRMALNEQREGNRSIEERGRTVVFSGGGMADDGRSGYLVVRTDKAGKPPHFHTIVIREDTGLTWRIVHWHTGG